MTPEKGGDRPKVLLVEDEPGMIPLMQKVLRGAGFEVTTVKRVDQARDLLADQPFNYVVNDRGLEDGSSAGVELIDHMLDKYPQVPVLLVTGNPEDARHELAAVGAAQVQVIAKPDIVAPLMQASQQVMHGAFPIAQRGEKVALYNPSDATVGPPRFGASSVLDEARPGGFSALHAPRPPIQPISDIRPFGESNSGGPGGRGGSPFR
jgi:CheY-like chemotaxis protein